MRKGEAPEEWKGENIVRQNVRRADPHAKIYIALNEVGGGGELPSTRRTLNNPSSALPRELPFSDS